MSDDALRREALAVLGLTEDDVANAYAVRVLRRIAKDDVGSLDDRRALDRTRDHAQLCASLATTERERMSHVTEEPLRRARERAAATWEVEALLHTGLLGLLGERT